MADTEPTKDVTTGSAEIRWPDPTRPIISERDGAPSQGWGGYPQQPGYGSVGYGPPPQTAGVGLRRWHIIAAALVLLVLILVLVWLLWWR